MRRGVPLEAALVVCRGPFVLTKSASLVDLAEVVRRVADLVALRVISQKLLQENLGSLLIVREVGARPPLLVPQRIAVKFVRLRDVVTRLQPRVRHVQV